MSRRLELQETLETLLGRRNVYFQPPEDIKMQYPCIIYTLDVINTTFADDSPYLYQRRWKVTTISRDPENPVADAVGKMPSCVHTTRFAVAGLTHDVFNLYY